MWLDCKATLYSPLNCFNFEIRNHRDLLSTMQNHVHARRGYNLESALLISMHKHIAGKEGQGKGLSCDPASGVPIRRAEERLQSL